jgi:hypothetical protein
MNIRLSTQFRTVEIYVCQHTSAQLKYMFSTSRPQCSNKRFAPNVRTVNDAMYKHNTHGSCTGYQQELKLKLLRWVREGLSNVILTDC